MFLSVISRQLLPPLVVITPSFVRPGTSLHVEDIYVEIKKCDYKIFSKMHLTGIKVLGAMSTCLTRPKLQYIP